MTARRIVSGSSGFIGGHLCRELLASDAAFLGVDRVAPPAGASWLHTHADLRDDAALADVAPDGARVVYHLAAEAEVLIPFAKVPDFIGSNVNGTLHLLDRMAPEVVVFASSSAVYGNARPRGVTTHWSHVNPLGVYGMSKAMGELILRDWAAETGRAAVAFRFGNVIGPGCRGLIPFLVDHALRHPDGDAPAMCRGGGTIVRDYLPVDFLARLLVEAGEALWDAWPRGALRAYNVGTGRPMTNGDVGRIVQAFLRRQGLSLEIDWSTPVPAAESRAVVLDMKQTERRFSVPLPSEDDVVAAIEATAAARMEEPRA